MATLVLTVIGDDRSGLVEALSSVIARHGGNWERSRMAELAGKFAGIVLVSVPDESSDALVAELAPLSGDGLLDITVERGAGGDHHERPVFLLSLLGNDQPGIVHEVSAALASRGVSISDLRTETRAAPMAGGVLFEAEATLEAPPGMSGHELREVLEQLAGALMVDIELE
jgi:glycine cleavage system regulatory protein